MDVERHASIEAWAAAGNLSNVMPPLAIDVTKHPWPVSAADAVMCINVIHISPGGHARVDGGRRQDPARRWLDLVWRKSNGTFPGARDLINGFA
jgi:hypothetical protein